MNAQLSVVGSEAAPSAAPNDFASLLERVHAIGREIVAPNAEAVDRDARFPAESFAALICANFAVK